MAEATENETQPAEATAETQEAGISDLQQARDRIAALERDVSQRDMALTALRKSEGELREKLTTSQKDLGESVAGYRALVLQLNPSVVADLVNGESVAAINESLAKAKTLVGRVRQSLAKEVAAARIPIGSPGRQNPDLSALSPREKINYGIGGKR